MEKTAIVDLIVLHDFFAKKKAPTARELAAMEKINLSLLRTAESLVHVGPLPE